MTKKTYADASARYVYALVGGGDLVVEKTTGLARKGLAMADRRRKDAVRLYGDLAGRGERLVGRVRKADPAKRVSTNAKQAQKQLKGAVTSVRKALGIEEKNEQRNEQKKATSRKAS